MKAIRAGEIVPGNVVVVRNVGPVGGPGMPEMVMLTIQLQGRGLGEDVALITDGRFSGVSHGILIGHISPGGGTRRPDRGGARWRYDRHRSGQAHAESGDLRRGAGTAHGRLAPARGGHPAAPGSVHDKYTNWCRQPITAAWSKILFDSGFPTTITSHPEEVAKRVRRMGNRHGARAHPSRRAPAECSSGRGRCWKA